ncbi:hypothetical protein [Staphylococcus saprophyticus]|uniref:Uncharacterized protein n=1 Tax=Staphylococcus saprophyticus TaxID=29385 RepID=A0A380HM54_STASA|nr:hypothetical protein [Staphylococcus saprophyticus]SUM82685.1 Uncharacterised protein [Staphylococcus saprophyticus]
MAEINHRYLKDNDGDLYYPITHIDAVQGIDQEGTDNALTDMNDKINQMNTLIDKANKTIEEQQKTIKNNSKDIEILDLAMGDMVGDTGWIDYQVPSKMKNEAVKSGFPCSIREVRAGSSMNEKSFLIKSIRFNITGIKDGQQIAQLPTGFITNIQTVDIVGSARKAPVSLKLRDTGVVEAQLKDYDTSNESWIYGQYTWLE